MAREFLADLHDITGKTFDYVVVGKLSTIWLTTPLTRSFAIAGGGASNSVVWVVNPVIR